MLCKMRCLPKWPLYLLAALLLSMCSSNKKTPQTANDNVIDVLLYPSKSLLRDFQIVPVVAIRNSKNFRQLLINKEDRILFQNRILTFDELEMAVREISSEVSDIIICIDCDLDRIPDKPPSVDHLMKVFEVLKSADVERICFGHPKPWIRSTLNSINQPWENEKNQIPSCEEFFETISSTDTSKLKPDLTIENIIYTDNDMILTIKNIGSYDLTTNITTQSLPAHAATENT